ncbi:hypothetical protein [Cellulomonas sp. Leaf395]|uniref:hypothetical protein n=1 Tax=Cellulomonas sp. Leaf395 TaxID=1736362 RepID=UPI0012F9FE12|nr:hypothetical protein [Cellulomonas sp. Leaf395]
MRSSRGIERVPTHEQPVDAPAEARTGERMVQPETPLPVVVWVTSGRGKSFAADGHAVAWTTSQVRVRYLDPGGREGFAWVWASAGARRFTY